MASDQTLSYTNISFQHKFLDNCWQIIKQRHQQDEEVCIIVPTNRAELYCQNLVTADGYDNLTIHSINHYDDQKFPHYNNQQLKIIIAFELLQIEDNPLLRDMPFFVALQYAETLIELLEELVYFNIEIASLEALVPQIYEDKWRDSLAIIKHLYNHTENCEAHGKQMFWRQFCNDKANVYVLGVEEARPYILDIIKRSHYISYGWEAQEAILATKPEPTHPNYKRQLIIKQCELRGRSSLSDKFNHNSPHEQLVRLCLGDQGYQQPDISTIADRVCWLKCNSLPQQADIIAEQAHNSDERVSIVCADPLLATLITDSCFNKYGYRPNTSTGIALKTTIQAQFLLYCLRVIDDSKAIIIEELYGFLFNPLLRVGHSLLEAKAITATIDVKYIRKTPPLSDRFSLLIKQLITRVEDDKTTADKAEQQSKVSFLQAILASTANFLAINQAKIIDWLDQLLEMLTQLSCYNDSSYIFTKQNGRLLQDFLADFRQANEDNDILVNRVDFINILEQAINGVALPHVYNVNKRISLHGVYEAVLMASDLVICAGMQEEVWPSYNHSQHWLNNQMRETLGLPDPHALIAAQANVFLQLLSKPKVIITTAKYDNEKPLLPSRWLTLLNFFTANKISNYTISEGFIANRSNKHRKILMVDQYISANPKLRPQEITVTQLDLLIQNPMAYYLRYIEQVASLPAPLPTWEARDKGDWIHKNLEVFHAKHDIEQISKADAHNQLIQIGQQNLPKDADKHPKIRLFWLRHWRKIAHSYVNDLNFGNKNQQNRHYRVNSVEKQISYNWQLKSGESIKVIGKADRVDISQLSNNFKLIDYKTGGIPSKKSLADLRGDLQILILAILWQKKFNQQCEAVEFINLKYDAVKAITISEGLADLLTQCEAIITDALSYLVTNKPFLTNDDKNNTKPKYNVIY
jgi:RecB family exonuclease